MADATLTVGVDTKEAERGLSRFASTAERATSGLEKSFGALKAAAGAAFAFVAGKAVVGAIGDFVTAAREQEQALQNVATAMGRTGEFSKEAFADVKAFADGLQSVKGVSDDAALSAFALAKSFGASNDQAKLAVDAAVELSAATGKSLDEAIRGVSKTFGGMAGELGEVNPAIKALTAEQLKAGKAAEVLLKQFGGTAAANLQTFGGALTQTKNGFGELQESLGNLIVQNPVVIRIVQEVGRVFDRLSQTVDENGEGFRGLFNKGISVAIRGLGELLPLLKAPLAVFDLINQLALTAGAGVLQFVRVFTQFETVQLVLKTTASVFIALVDKITTGIRVIVQTVGALGDKLGLETGITDGLTDALEGFRSKLATVDEGLVTLDINGKLDSATQTLLDFRETSSKAFGSAKEAIDAAAKSTVDFGKELGKLGATTAGPTAKNLPGGGAGGGLRPVDPAKASQIGPPVPVVVKGESSQADKKEEDRQLTKADFFKGALDALTAGGEAGAKQAVGLFGAGIATVFGASGPVAQGVSQFVQFLGQNPDTFREAIDGFVRGIPEIIDNIVANIPTLVVAIAENSGEIITALVSASPRIIVALVQAMPVVARALLNELVGGFDYQGTKFAAAFDGAIAGITTAGEQVGAFFAEIPNKIGAAFIRIYQFDQELRKLVFGAVQDFVGSFGRDFATSVANAGTAFFNGIVEAVNAFIDGITPSGGGSKGNPFYTGSSKKGPITGVRGSPLATGGTIPMGYPGDTFPARLTSGEEVVNTATADQLREFLNGGQQAQLSLLARIASLLEGRQVAEARLVLDGATLASAQLDLARRNARTG